HVTLALRTVPYGFVVGGPEGIPALRTSERKLDTILHFRVVQFPPPVGSDEFTEFRRAIAKPASLTMALRQAVELTLDSQVFRSPDRFRIAAFFQPVGINQARCGIVRFGKDRTEEVVFVAHNHALG